MRRAFARRTCLVVAATMTATVAAARWNSSAAARQTAAAHPRLLFDRAGLDAIRTKARTPALASVAGRVIARANALLSAPPLLVSTTGRGEPDPPGHLKGLEAARRLQGRALTCAMAFLLSADRRYRDAAVAELDHAIAQWPIWVDTAHEPPYDLMTGEISLTFGLVYDWLFDALSPEERSRLREGVERRALGGYLEAATRRKPPFWFTAPHNWNPVCNGGAAVLALSLGDDSAASRKVLDLAAPAMASYWNHLRPDGGWDEGTGYWTFGHRYAFMAADALRRAGRPEGADYLSRPGARATGNFPLVFNPGRALSASFGDSPGRAADPLFYFLAREYHNPDFAWFEDRATPKSIKSEGWPDDALALVWREAGEGAREAPRVPAVTTFPSIGWAMLAPSQPDPPFFLAFKNGSLAANHSHLDLNHVSVGIGDTMLLTDLGSRPYPADYFTRATRYAYYEISTAGHNTVLVGGKGQVPGRAGALRGPFEGDRYAAVVGVADDTYEVPTKLARRTAVLVDRRYYVLLDEIETITSQSVELRFHTYATLTETHANGWSVSAGTAALDIVSADAGLVSPVVETATGWIRPVNVLRFVTRTPASRFVLATAILPGADAGGREVTERRVGDELTVSIGADRVKFRATPDGYGLVGVSIAASRLSKAAPAAWMPHSER